MVTLKLPSVRVRSNDEPGAVEVVKEAEIAIALEEINDEAPGSSVAVPLMLTVTAVPAPPLWVNDRVTLLNSRKSPRAILLYVAEVGKVPLVILPLVKTEAMYVVHKSVAPGA